MTIKQFYLESYPTDDMGKDIKDDATFVGLVTQLFGEGDVYDYVTGNEFIERLPNQYNYQVMERGATLSLGQRQLISFVRALVFKPKILILDEATSSVDSETEFIVQKAINKLVQNRTSIIIAHRLATIKQADKIIVMDKGLIVEEGSHLELLEKENGYYKNLYDKQFSLDQAS